MANKDRGGDGPGERASAPGSVVDEDVVVRQYRYLLRTAPADALEAAHAEALAGPASGVREAVLDAVREAFVAGQRVSPDRVAVTARLLVAGERRSPGAFLAACDARTLGVIAQGVVGSEAAFGLFSGYSTWDGAEPGPADVGVDHGGAPVVGTQPDPAAEAKAFAAGHGSTVLPWGGAGAGF
jgi:hypothetical protein